MLRVESILQSSFQTNRPKQRDRHLQAGHHWGLARPSHLTRDHISIGTSVLPHPGTCVNRLCSAGEQWSVAMIAALKEIPGPAEAQCRCEVRRVRCSTGCVTQTVFSLGAPARPEGHGNSHWTLCWPEEKESVVTGNGDEFPWWPMSALYPGYLTPRISCSQGAFASGSKWRTEYSCPFPALTQSSSQCAPDLTYSRIIFKDSFLFLTKPLSVRVIVSLICSML